MTLSMSNHAFSSYFHVWTYVAVGSQMLSQWACNKAVIFFNLLYVRDFSALSSYGPCPCT